MSKAKYIVEGGSSNRPPFFDGSDYYFWKNKMQLFLKSQDTGMWHITTDGDFTPRVDQDDSNSALKKEAYWTAEDKAKVLLNSKAQLFLSCALRREESERLDECTTAKEVWDTLQTHHEGTSHVKETRIDIGIRKFKLFEMQEGETIDEMYSRFTTIVNEMRSLGKAYTVQERVRKIMRCLPIIWRPMVTAISQAKNLESLPLEELIGTLRAHEVVLQEDKPVKKGKAIALKVSQDKITVPVEEESEENEQGDADEVTFLTRRIQKMMRRRDQIKKGFQNRNPKTEIDKSQVTCFGCNKLGHYKAECPSNKNPPKRFPFKKKSMMATWDDSEESETEEEEEEANICLMAKTEEDEVMNSEPCHLCQQMGNEFDNLLNDSNLLIQKCSSLKEQFYKEKEEKERNQTENNLLKKMIQELKETRVFESEECQEHSALQTENVQLKNENELLKTDLLNFIKATETFHNIMGSQIGIFDKAGLGFNQTQKTKLYENFFVGFQNTKRKPWFLDSGCSRHMTGDRNCFITFSKKDGGSVTFGNDDQAQIKGNGTIGKTNSAQINDVQYVEGLKHNLLSISQLCDNGCEVIFKPKVCEIKKAKTGKILFSGKRKKNLYVLYTKGTKSPPQERSPPQEHSPTAPPPKSSSQKNSKRSSPISTSSDSEPSPPTKKPKQNAPPLISLAKSKLFNEKWAQRPVGIGRIFVFDNLVVDGNAVQHHTNGVEIRLTPDILANILQLPTEGPSVYGDNWYAALGLRKTDVLAELFEENSTRYLATYLKPLPKVFNNMCQHTLLPHCGSHEYVSDNDALLIYHLLNCKRLNLPHVILQHMICAAQKDYKKNIVPYGMVLTKIFRHFGVSLASEKSLIKISKFSTKNLSHMRNTASAPTPTPLSCPISLKRKRSAGRRPSRNSISFSSPSTDPNAISNKTPSPERSPPPPERSPELIPSHPTLFAQTSGTIPSHIPSYSQPLHCPTHDFSTLLSNPLLSTMSPLFVSPQKTSSSIFGISQFLNFPATADHSTSSVGPLPSISSSFASLPSLSTMSIPSNTVVATSSQPSAHLPSTSTLAAPSHSDIMAALQIIMARQIQHDQETALLRTWMADHLAPKLGIPPPPPHPVPPPSQIPPAGKSSSSEGSSPSLAS
uniref:Uncharacterized protein LOC113788187 n=1 Tax=Cicer arietinum TaxID=3827 RepID=A0A3Q7XIB6_CICAR|nr:uncharacterized protein LOC113788187 [Cicer arietinum]